MPQAAYGAAVLWAQGAGYGAYATYIGAVAYVGTAYAISYAAQEILAPGANKPQQQNRGPGQSISNAQGVIGGSALATTIRQSAPPRRLLYGTLKTGGVLVYAKKTPNERFLHLAVYLGEGPIQGITGPVYLGDRRSNEAQYAGLVTTQVFTGAAGQTHSAALAAVSEGEWTSAMVGNGCAYVHTRYEYQQDRWDVGPALPAFTVLGRLVYDPRTAAVLTTATSNPALCILDFLRSEFGYQFDDSAIDFDSFAVAANVCDQIVNSVDGSNVVDGVAGRVRRYSLNGAFDVDVGPKKTVEGMLACCAGQLVRSGGKWRLYVGAYRAPTGPQLTAEYLREAPSYRAFPARQQRYNIARGTYREPRQDWQDTSIHDQILSAAIVAEDGEIVQSVDLPAVTNSAQAQRLARTYMNLARSAVPTILRCNFAALQWAPYDVVDLDLPQIGAEGPFLITKIDYIDMADGGGIDLTLVPHLGSDYAWDAATMERVVETVVAPNMEFTPPTTTITSALVQNLYYDGSDQVDRLITWLWTEPDWAILSYYELQIKKGTEDWVTYQVAEPKWVMDASPSFAYYARVRNVGLNGKKSAWSNTFTVSVLKDTTTAAGTASSITVTSAANHVISWTNPTDSNFSRMRLLQVDGPGLGSPNVISTSPGRPGSRQSIPTAFPAGTHYALQSETVDGALGTIVYAGEGTTDATTLIGDEIAPINNQIADLSDRVDTLEGAGP
jgi:hypothetical protein